MGYSCSFNFDFNLTRDQTWLPLFVLVTTGILGAVDDILNMKGKGTVKGLGARPKFIWLIAFSAVGAWWFYSKLGFNMIHIPAMGDFNIGFWYIPFFILVVVATANAVNITDGLDGLAGGLLAMAFSALAWLKALICSLDVAACSFFS